MNLEEVISKYSLCLRNDKENDKSDRLVNFFIKNKLFIVRVKNIWHKKSKNTRLGKISFKMANKKPLITQKSVNLMD